MANRYIPEQVKRRVRRECYFGCVICGLPLFQYDHIELFSARQDHDIDNIALLCPNHHDQKTRGLLPTAKVASARKKPRNASRTRSTSMDLSFSSDAAKFRLGSIAIESEPLAVGEIFPALTIGGRLVYGAENCDGHLLLHAAVCDAAGETILQIVRGELALNTGVFDFKHVGKRFLIKSRLFPSISIVIKKNDAGIHISQSHFYYKYTDIDGVSRTGLLEFNEDTGLTFFPSTSFISGLTMVGLGVHMRRDGRWYIGLYED